MSAFHLVCVAFYVVSSLCVNGYNNRKVKQENGGLPDTGSAVPFWNVGDEQILEQPHASTSAQPAEDVLESAAEEVDEMEKESGQTLINLNDTSPMRVIDMEDELCYMNPPANDGSGTQSGVQNRKLLYKDNVNDNTMPPPPYSNSPRDDINIEVEEENENDQVSRMGPLANQQMTILYCFVVIFLVICFSGCFILFASFFISPFHSANFIIHPIFN